MKQTIKIQNVQPIKKKDVATKVTDPIKYEDPQRIMDRSTMVIGNHSKRISDVCSKDPHFTSLKTIPTAVFSKHKNVIKSFKRNFAKETEFYVKNSSIGNYFTEDETKGTKRDYSHSPVSRRTLMPSLRE